MHWTRSLDDPALAAFAARERDGVRLLVRSGYEAWVDRFGLGSEEAWSGEVVGGGRRPHPLVELPGGERVVVRRYLRGGAVRHLNRARYFVGDRAFEELRAVERARAGGVRTPVVIAAAQRQHAFGYSAWLATRWIPSALDLCAWLRARSPAERAEALREAGRQIARMHAAGVAHPDLNLRNLLVAPAGAGGAEEVHLLDFDRARLHTGPVPAARRGRDLLRLARSARKLRAPIDGAGWEALRAGYGEGWPLRSFPG